MDNHAASAPPPRHVGGTIVKAWLLATLVEALTLPPALLTMGHAGPEGRFAALGWVGLLVNLPGLLVTRAILRPGAVSLVVLGSVIYLFQVVLFGYIFFRLLKRRSNIL